MVQLQPHVIRLLGERARVREKEREKDRYREREKERERERRCHAVIQLHMGTLLINKRTPLELFRRPMPRVLVGSLGGGRSLIVEVPLYASTWWVCGAH